MKLCTKCKIKKSFDEFYTDKHKKSGYRSNCKTCTAKSKANYYKNNKQAFRKASKKSITRNQEYVYNFLLKNPCCKCGESEPMCLDFDHIDPKSKDANICSLIFNCVSLDKLQSEIDKCQVLCANCHRKKTAQEVGSFKYKMSLDN